jgi:hypothetical protein
MFQLGDVVTTKKTGPPSIARIIAIFIDGSQWCKSFNRNPETYSDYWNELFPDWIDKPVYFISYKDSQRIVSMEEWLNQDDKADELRKIPRKYLTLVYERLNPVYEVAASPEDDLEIFEGSD